MSGRYDRCFASRSAQTLALLRIYSCQKIVNLPNNVFFGCWCWCQCQCGVVGNVVQYRRKRPSGITCDLRLETETMTVTAVIIKVNADANAITTFVFLVECSHTRGTIRWKGRGAWSFWSSKRCRYQNQAIVHLDRLDFNLNGLRDRRGG